MSQITGIRGSFINTFLLQYREQVGEPIHYIYIDAELGENIEIFSIHSFLLFSIHILFSDIPPPHKQVNGLLTESGHGSIFSQRGIKERGGGDSTCFRIPAVMLAPFRFKKDYIINRQFKPFRNQNTFSFIYAYLYKHCLYEYQSPQ